MRKKKRSGWVDVVGWVVLALVLLKGAGWLTASFLRESMAREAGFESHAALVAFAEEEVAKADRKASAEAAAARVRPLIESQIRDSLRAEGEAYLQRRLIEEGLAE